MFFRIRNFLLLLAVLSLSTGMHAFANEPSSDPTHKQARSIAPFIGDSKAMLNTFCLGSDSNLWMSVGSRQDPKLGAVVVYTGEGKKINEIQLSFVPQAMNFAPDGNLFVAGSGKVAKIDPSGKVLIEKDAPNIGNSEEMMEKMKESQKKQAEQMTAQYRKLAEQLETQIAKFEKVPDDETEKAKATRERRLKLLIAQKEQYANMEKTVGDSLSSQLSTGALQRMMRATGMAVTSDDVFVSLPQTTGYGYSIFRMNHELDEATSVVKSVSGCCGQLDIQTDGKHLIIAENTAFQVGYYDRDGKRLSGFGSRDRTKTDGFGSCCNPMNVRCCDNGEILTAESSIGDIKRFSSDGKFLGLVGRASIGGGCKHVAIGFDAKRNWHYMMNVDRSTVAVLVPKSEAPAETDEERLTREATQGLGKKLVGTWERIKEENATAGSNPYASGMFDQWNHLEFAASGTLSNVVTKKMSDDAESKPKAKSNSGLLGALFSLFGSNTTSTTDVSVDTGSKTWRAIQQKDNQLEFVIVQDSVQGYGAVVEFVGDDEAKLSWFYGDPSAKMGMEAKYKRISKEACGEKCT
ncbi:MAG: hypothetical protein ABL921_32600, partial [Pirellula sp.]